MDKTEVMVNGGGGEAPTLVDVNKKPPAVVSARNDMVDRENETLRDRVADLERRVHDQNDEITCLRATLADALRRINTIEDDKGHVQVNHVASQPRVQRREHPALDGRQSTPHRRPMSSHYTPQYVSSHRMQPHESISRRSSYASNRDRSSSHGVPQPHRKSVVVPYQSTGSLASDDRSSIVSSPGSNNNVVVVNKNNMSGSVTNLLTGSRKWNSTSDFSRAVSPSPRRLHSGSMQSLRSPFGSSHNLSDRAYSSGMRHGTREAQYDEDEGVVQLFVRGRPVHLYVPSALLGKYSMSKVNPAPNLRPKLEWVYGYRGRDARNNLYLLPTGEMIYFIASVVVLFNAEEHSQRHYLGHTDEIKCLAVHPNKLLIATGQTSGRDRREGKPHIRIWNSVSLATLHVIGAGEFDRAVVCIAFSKADGGNLLLAVDEGGEHTMSIWDWSRGDRGSKVTETKCANEVVISAEFHPLEATTIVSVGRGHVHFWTLDPSALTLSRKTGIFDNRDKPKYVTSLAFSFTGDVITGDSNGNIFVWARAYNAVTKVLRKVHDGPVFSVCVLKDGSIVTGGGKDRRLVQFDANYKRTGVEAELPEHLGAVRTISQGKGSQLLIGSTRNSLLQGTFELNFHEIVTGHVDEVWALAAHPNQNQFISAAFDQHIHLWDAIAHRTVWSSDLGDAAQSACFLSTGEVIALGMASGKWLAIDTSTREVYAVHQDGHEPIQSIKFSPNDELLALGAKDNSIYVYQVEDGGKRFSRIGRCVGHHSPVASLDWSEDSVYIQSNSTDHEILYWSASMCRQVSKGGSTLRDVQWHSTTCLLNFNSLGIWPESSDGTDLCASASNKKLLVTADDFGKIKLYSYPANQPKCLHHTAVGHSSHVTQLDFLASAEGSTRFVSAGGRDHAVMQWTVE